MQWPHGCNLLRDGGGETSPSHFFYPLGKCYGVHLTFLPVSFYKPLSKNVAHLRKNWAKNIEIHLFLLITLSTIIYLKMQTSFTSSLFTCFYATSCLIFFFFLHLHIVFVYYIQYYKLRCYSQGSTGKLSLLLL